MIKTYQDIPVSLNEELGEIICPECEGYGATPKEIKSMDEIQMTCQKCQGTGKVDWCQAAVGVPPPKDFRLSFTDFAKNFLHDDNKDILPYQQALIDKLSQDLADKIDAEILESLQGNLEQNDDKTKFIRGSVYDHRVIS